MFVNFVAIPKQNPFSNLEKQPNDFLRSVKQRKEISSESVTIETLTDKLLSSKGSPITQSLNASNFCFYKLWAVIFHFANFN